MCRNMHDMDAGVVDYIYIDSFFFRCGPPGRTFNLKSRVLLNFHMSYDTNRLFLIQLLQENLLKTTDS